MPSDRLVRYVTVTWGCPMHSVFTGPVDPLDELQESPHTCQLDGGSCVTIDHPMCPLNRYEEVVLKRNPRDVSRRTGD